MGYGRRAVHTEGELNDATGFLIHQSKLSQHIILNKDVKNICTFRKLIVTNLNARWKLLTCTGAQGQNNGAKSSPKGQYMVMEGLFWLFIGQHHRYWEADDKCGEVSVAGRIHQHKDFWHNELEASGLVLGIIDEGYKLPFKKDCPPFFAKNNLSARQHRKFATEAILKLVKAGCAQEVPNIPYCCNPLTVADKDGKLRLVLDLRHVNLYLTIRKFRYENLKTLQAIFKQGFYFATFDLKNGYHHVSINPEYHRYLGFQWEFEGKTRWFVFVVMPFGLATAAYAFTKLVRPFVKKWREGGMRSIVYLDDGIFGSAQYSKTLEDCRTVRRDLTAAGWYINEEKSNLVPHQEGRWLGFTIDTVHHMFWVPGDKIKKVLTRMEHTLWSERTTPRNVAKIAGQIISMEPAIGPLTSLMTRRMYKFVDNGEYWDEPKKLTSEARREIMFWSESIVAHNGYRIKPKHAITKVVYSDASNDGYGGYIVSKLDKPIAQGSFNEKQKEKSSTHREVFAVLHVLESLKKKLQGETILWHSDNINVAKIITKGSKKPDMQDIAMAIFSLCIKYNITIIPRWIPREENMEADAISKLHDTDNWGIDWESFNYIQECFGTFTIDRFADERNKKTGRFNSRFHTPGAEAANAFSVSWQGDFNWWSPPISLVGDTLEHARICKAKGVLLVPLWKSAYYFCLLTDDGKRFHPFIKSFLLLDPYYYNNSGGHSVFSGFAHFQTLALLVDFS